MKHVLIMYTMLLGTPAGEYADIRPYEKDNLTPEACAEHVEKIKKLLKNEQDETTTRAVVVYCLERKPK